MSDYKNIIFDLGGVLLNIDVNRTKSAFENLGVKSFDSLYNLDRAHQLFKDLECGRIDENDFYNRFNQLTGLRLAGQEIREAWNAMLLDFRESSLDYLNELSQKGNLFLLSNTNKIHIDAFRKIYHRKPRSIAFEDHFKKAIYSCDAGVRKPEAECYQWVLNETGIRAGETLFIDDTFENISGAHAAGIKSILLEKGKRIEDLNLQAFLE